MRPLTFPVSGVIPYLPKGPSGPLVVQWVHATSNVVVPDVPRVAANSVRDRRYTYTMNILITVLVAVLVYWLLLFLGLPMVVGVVAAILVLLGGLSGRF